LGIWVFVGFKKSCAFEGKKKGLRKFDPSDQRVFFFHGNFHKLAKKKRKEKDILRGFVEKFQNF
jgi:hypothetical protein